MVISMTTRAVTRATRSLIPVSWKTAVDITHSSGGYISSCGFAASCATHRNKSGKARANPHSERDHHYSRRTHRGECGVVPSFALSKNRSCCGINSDPGPVFHRQRALSGSRGGESNWNLGRRGGSRTLALSELVSPRVSLTRKRFLARTPCAFVRSGTLPELMRGNSSKPSCIGRSSGA